LDEAPSTVAKSRNPVRRLYDWVIGWAESPYSEWALFLLAFCEASFFPVPPDVLLLALAFGAVRKSFRYAFICSVGSVVGALLGYAIGYWFYEYIGRPIIEFYHYQKQIEYVMGKYRENAFLFISIAGFTIIPFKVFTIAAGMAKVSVGVLVAASAFSRTTRFFAVATLAYFFGQRVRRFIERYFDLLAIAFVVILVFGFVILKWMK